MNLTLFRYLFRMFLICVASIFSLLYITVFIGELIEAMRRFSAHDSFHFFYGLKLAFYKTPATLVIISFFILLASSLYFFWKLSARSEFVVIRGSGVSVWQFLYPVLSAAVLISLVKVFMILPISSYLNSLYVKHENILTNKQILSLSSEFSKSGVWLRQQDELGGYSVLHAKTVNEITNSLGDVSILVFDSNNSYVDRIDADSAKILDDKWVLFNVNIYPKIGKKIHEKALIFKTNYTLNKIKKNLVKPDMIVIWDLPNFISNLEKAGFDPSSYRLRFQQLLSMPLVYIVAILLGVLFSLHHFRQYRRSIAIIMGIGVGFGFYLMMNILSVQALVGYIPIYIAIWAPLLIFICISCSILVHLEDG